MKKRILLVSLLLAISVFFMLVVYYISYNAAKILIYEYKSHPSCPPRMENYCYMNRSCSYITYYSYYEGQCIPAKCGTRCSSSPCKSDLTVPDTTYRIFGSIVYVNATVKNIGDAEALPSTIHIAIAPGVVQLINTPALAAYGGSALASFSYWQAPGTTYYVNITADANNEIDELNETNNAYILKVVMQP